MALERYMALVERFPLRPMRDEAQYEAGVEVLKDLALRYEELAPDEVDYFDALSQFVGDYEQQHFRRESARLEPIEALRFLMAENGMSVADLGRVLGSASVASMILAGDRELSKAHIRKLAERFSVDASLFLGTQPCGATEPLAENGWAAMVVEMKSRQDNWTLTCGGGRRSTPVSPFPNGFQYRMAS